MKLATILTPAGPRVAALVNDAYVDLHATDSGLPVCMKELLAASPSVRKAAADAAANPKAVKFLTDAVKLLPPVPNPTKILCVGLNYADHAREGGKAIPTEPVLFCKYSNTLIAPGETIKLPKVAQKVDYEAELVIVIGKKGKHIPNDESAMEYVGGYTCGHDVSARDWQFRGEAKQWTIGKTFDTFAPIGPVVVTADELTDPHTLQIQLRLNGADGAEQRTPEGVHLQRPAPALVPVAGGDAGAGRPDLHRHPAGRRHLPEPPGGVEGRRRGGSGSAGHRHPEEPGRGGVTEPTGLPRADGERAALAVGSRQTRWFTASAGGAAAVAG